MQTRQMINLLYILSLFTLILSPSPFFFFCFSLCLCAVSIFPLFLTPHLSLPPCFSPRSAGEDGSLGVCQQQYHRMRTYRLLSPIINASIYATVPSHNRWSISTQLLFTRLSQPTAAPQAPNRRDGEIVLSLGVGWGGICEKFIVGAL